MFIHPEINPILIAIGPLQIRWYGLMYVLAFIAAYWLILKMHARILAQALTKDDIYDLLFYVALAVVLGGRIGFFLLYEPMALLHEPMTVLKFWLPGRSFHAGLLAVAFALWLFAKHKQLSFLAVCDVAALATPIGLGLGRLGNYINGELWGRATTMPWGVIFRHIDLQPRHPSQLYEFFLEGICLFIILINFSRKPRPHGHISAMFLLGYGSFRILAECFREPDLDLGFILFNSLTMGQILSVPMILIGIYVLLRKKACSNI